MNFKRITQIGLIAICFSVTVYFFGLTIKTLIFLISGFFLYVLYENLWYVYGTGKILKSLIYHYGVECPFPDTLDFANGKLYFDEIQDYVTVTVIPEGLHIRCLGICSAVIEWKYIKKINNDGLERIRLYLERSGEPVNSSLLLPWDYALNSVVFKFSKLEILDSE